MNKNKIAKSPESLIEVEQEFQGVYGKYKITLKDKSEVKLYRIAVLICGISFFFGLLQWIVVGPNNAWLWLIPMSLSLGLALQWIHIYIKIIHQTLKLFWAIGSLVIVILMLKGNPHELLSDLSINNFQALTMGPFFASLTGLGFKEFFCFRQPEAIGVTLFLPITLLGHIFGILSPTYAMSCLSLSSVLLLILAFRKLGMDPAKDIGDKSVFEYLANTNN